MTPEQQLQRLIAQLPKYKPVEIVSLLPLAATFLSALCVRTMALQDQAALPETDYLLNTRQFAQRIGKTPKWVREHVALFNFGFPLGQEHKFSARGFDQWIAENRAATMAAALPPERRQHER